MPDPSSPNPYLEILKEDAEKIPKKREYEEYAPDPPKVEAGPGKKFPCPYCTEMVYKVYRNGQYVGLFESGDRCHLPSEDQMWRVMAKDEPAFPFVCKEGLDAYTVRTTKPHVRNTYKKLQAEMKGSNQKRLQKLKRRKSKK